MNQLYPILFWTLLIFNIVFIIVLPKYGLLARWQVRKKCRQRELLEDALKLIFNAPQEGQGHPADKFRLAVELNINMQATEKLIERLESQKLAKTEKNHLYLTLEGQKCALQVIRAHRLWERYLADEARMPLEKIHTAAHSKEHTMSVEEVDELDAALGHPSHDPHGDPIPNAAGVLREDSPSLSLIEMKAGQSGNISHLEDEPPMAYAQLLANGFYIGQALLVQENTPERVVVVTGDEEHVLAQPIAQNINVQLEEIKELPTMAAIPLNNLARREKAEIVCIDDRCQGFTRRRFLDLGLTPGTTIFPELENAFTEPRAYRVRGTLIALRHDQAELIRVKPVDIKAA